MRQEAPPQELWLASERRDYGRAPLDCEDLVADPLVQLALWLERAVSSGVPWATAMLLATVSPAGHPSARAVLLKAVDASGLVFFTNYESRKARQVARCPLAAATFLWPPLERQVRVEGSVERLPAPESDAYFRTRPRGSQIGAWISPQSRPIEDRAFLESSYEAAERRFAGGEVPRPPHWGGFRLVPSMLEFWQGRRDRLHDRFRYRSSERGWRVDRLAP